MEQSVRRRWPLLSRTVCCRCGRCAGVWFIWTGELQWPLRIIINS